MNFDQLVKYLIWIVFFLLALSGMYVMLRRIGILQ